jgi:hypothetical protein
MEAPRASPYGACVRRNHLLTELHLSGQATELVLTIRRALRKYDGHLDKIAFALDLSRRNLITWLRRLELLDEAREIRRRSKLKFRIYPEVHRADEGSPR